LARSGGLAWVGAAVALGKSQAELLLQPLGHRLGHGRAAAAQIAQAAEIEALVVGAGEQVNDHGRNAGPVRDLKARDRATRQFTIPARQDHDRAAMEHRAQHAIEQSGDMEHRHHGQTHGFGRCPSPDAATTGIGHQGAVAVHATLGQPGGARGIGQQRQIVRLGRMRARLQRLRQRGRPMAGTGHDGWAVLDPCSHRVRHRHARIDTAMAVDQGIGVARHEQRRQLLRGRQRGIGLVHHAGQIGTADHDLGAGIGDVVAELLGLVHRVHRYHDCICTVHRIEGDQVLRTVLHEERYAVATLHALRLQPAGQRFGLLFQFGKAETLAAELHGQLVRETLGRNFQVEPQRCLRDLKLPGQATRPVAVLGDLLRGLNADIAHGLGSVWAGRYGGSGNGSGEILQCHTATQLSQQRHACGGARANLTENTPPRVTSCSSRHHIHFRSHLSPHLTSALL